MSSRITSEFGRLGERVSRTAARAGAPADTRSTAPTDAFRHVWVLTERGPRVAGVLTQWSHGVEGWRGRVLFALDADTVAWRWLPIVQLEPAVVED